MPPERSQSSHLAVNDHFARRRQDAEDLVLRFRGLQALGCQNRQAKAHDECGDQRVRCGSRVAHGRAFLKRGNKCSLGC